MDKFIKMTDDLYIAAPFPVKAFLVVWFFMFVLFIIHIEISAVRYKIKKRSEKNGHVATGILVEHSVEGWENDLDECMEDHKWKYQYTVKGKNYYIHTKKSQFFKYRKSDEEQSVLDSCDMDAVPVYYLGIWPRIAITNNYYFDDPSDEDIRNLRLSKSTIAGKILPVRFLFSFLGSGIFSAVVVGSVCIAFTLLDAVLAFLIRKLG